MKMGGLEEATSEIRREGRNMNNLSYADTTTLIVEYKDDRIQN